MELRGTHREAPIKMYYPTEKVWLEDAGSEGGRPM